MDVSVWSPWPGSSIKKKMSTPTSCSFSRKLRHCFIDIKNARRTRVSIGFWWVLTSFILFSIILQWNHLENARKAIIHVYFSAFTLAVSLESSLNPRPGGLGFKQLSRVTANVNAWKKHVWSLYSLIKPKSSCTLICRNKPYSSVANHILVIMKMVVALEFT